MKKMNKILSVGLSLVLCGSMIAPAFAAKVLNNDEINWSDDWKFAEGIEKGTLKGYTEEGSEEVKYDYYLADDLELRGTLIIGTDAEGKPITAEIDLNGHELALNKGLNPDEVDLTKCDTEKHGSVIIVEKGATLNLYGNKEGMEYGLANDDPLAEGVITGGTGTVAYGPYYSDIEAFGGGILVRNATLNMTGGRIENNVANSHGGALAVYGEKGTAELTNVVIADNRCRFYGGAVWSNGKTTLTNCTMENNATATYERLYGGVLATAGQGNALGEIIIDDCIIRNNTVSWGVLRHDGSGKPIVIDEGTSICDNVQTGGGEKVPANIDDTLGRDSIHIWVKQNELVQAGTCTTPAQYRDTCQSGCTAFSSGDLDLNNHTGHGERTERTEPQIGVPGRIDHYCDGCGGFLYSEPIPALTAGGNTNRVPTGSTPSEEPEAETTIGIEDEAVPLAGIFTRADAIGYLWEQTGRPDAELSDFPDVPEEHEWAVAIGWAQDMGIALADEDGNFRPDDLVLRSTEDVEGELQEFLNRYAVFAGVELDDGELFIELDGAADDVIMGEEAQEIFDLFFAQLEKALADKAA